MSIYCRHTGRNVRFELPEIDYQTLMQALSGYAYPRDRVTKLLRSGELVRVKFEADVDPPPGFGTEVRLLSDLSPIGIRA